MNYRGRREDGAGVYMWFLIHLYLLDAGEMALVPGPAYPSYEAAVKLAKAMARLKNFMA